MMTSGIAFHHLPNNRIPNPADYMNMPIHAQPRSRPAPQSTYNPQTGEYNAPPMSFPPAPTGKVHRSGDTNSPDSDDLWCDDEDLLAVPPEDPEIESAADPLFPSPHRFNLLVREYLGNLSPKKREKALLTQKMYDAVLCVLQDPKDTSTKTAQFRFWAKKMFELTTFGGEHVICHDQKPVAVKEQIYEVLCHSHQQAGHGGRDKTSSQVSALWPHIRDGAHLF
jgi:hypothetical protein